MLIVIFWILYWVIFEVLLDSDNHPLTMLLDSLESAANDAKGICIEGGGEEVNGYYNRISDQGPYGNPEYLSNSTVVGVGERLLSFQNVDYNDWKGWEIYTMKGSAARCLDEEDVVGCSGKWMLPNADGAFSPDISVTTKYC